jgi:hypothetical protein
VTPAKRSGADQHAATADLDSPTPAELRAAIMWSQRLGQVFNIDIETCPILGESVRIIACIEDAKIIEKILTHLDAKTAENWKLQSAPVVSNDGLGSIPAVPIDPDVMRSDTNPVRSGDDRCVSRLCENSKMAR